MTKKKYIYKHLLFIGLFIAQNIFFVQNAQAQLSGGSGINFQGVARNSNSIILASQSIAIRLSILQGSATGNLEYQETKTVNTNAQGLFNVIIGDGTATTTLGNYNNINWQLNPRFIKIEMDPSAGTNFVTLGTTQLQYVAYAYFANGVAAENIVGVVPVARGGTGATNLQNLKSSLLLDKVNNTYDSLKPISSATQAALNLKLNIVDANSLLNVKLNIADSTAAYVTPTQLRASSFDSTSLSTRINAKANTSNPVFSTDALINRIRVGRGNGNDSSNTVFGNIQFKQNNFGMRTTAIGYNALYGQTTENDNTAIGNSALNADSAKVGNDNIGIGVQTLRYNNAGSKNVAIGNMALYSKQAGDGNTAIGYGADAEGPIDLTNATAIGYNARVNQSNMIQLGNTDVTSVVTSGVISATGYRGNLTGNVIGELTGNATSATTAGNISATSNATLTSLANLNTVGTIANGVWSATTIDIAHGGTGLSTAGNANQILTSTGAGAYTLTNINTVAVPYTGATRAVDLGAYDLKLNGLSLGLGGGAISSNLIFGNDALLNNTTGSANIGIGNFSLKRNITGSSNIGIGSDALNSNLSGSSNIAIGISAMNHATAAIGNVAIGNGIIMYSLTTGRENTAIGSTAAISLSTGNYNTFLGANTDVASSNLSNTTAIGYGAVTDASNTIQLGNADITNVKTAGDLQAKTYILTGTYSTTASTATTTVDLSAGNVLQVLLTANTTLNFINPRVGTYIIKIKQDATGGWTVGFPTMKWADNTAPTITFTPDKIDLLTLIYDGVDYYGSCLQNF